MINIKNIAFKNNKFELELTGCKILKKNIISNTITQ